MRNRAHRSPVFAWLTRNTRLPSLRATLWLAAGLTLASLALTVFQMARIEEYPQLGYLLVDILGASSWGLHIIFPLAGAPIAALLLARETQGEGFQLLRVTPGYSPGGAVRGLVLAVLYRMRVPLILMVALLPTVMVEPYREEKQLASDECYVFVSREGWAEGDWYSDPYPDTCIEPSDRRLLLWAFMILLWPVGLWGVMLFNIALAVWLALWWGREGWVWTYLVSWLLCAAVVLMLIDPVATTPLGPTVVTSLGGAGKVIIARRWPPLELGGVALFSVVFYVLAWGALRLARRRA